MRTLLLHTACLPIPSVSTDCGPWPPGVSIIEVPLSRSYSRGATREVLSPRCPTPLVWGLRESDRLVWEQQCAHCGLKYLNQGNLCTYDRVLFHLRRVRMWPTTVKDVIMLRDIFVTNKSVREYQTKYLTPLSLLLSTRDIFNFLEWPVKLIPNSVLAMGFTTLRHFRKSTNCLFLWLLLLFMTIIIINWGVGQISN